MIVFTHYEVNEQVEVWAIVAENLQIAPVLSPKYADQNTVKNALGKYGFNIGYVIHSFCVLRTSAMNVDSASLSMFCSILPG